MSVVVAAMEFRVLFIAFLYTGYLFWIILLLILLLPKSYTWFWGRHWVYSGALEAVDYVILVVEVTGEVHYMVTSIVTALDSVQLQIMFRTVFFLTRLLVTNSVFTGTQIPRNSNSIGNMTQKYNCQYQ